MKSLKFLHNKRNCFARYLVVYSIVLIAFIIQTKVHAAPSAPNTDRHSIFDHLKQVKEKYRVDTAYIFYRLNFRHAPLAVAMANLDSLSVIATEVGDLSLKCSVFDMRADYYSVNHGFNKISTAYYQKAIDFAMV